MASNASNKEAWRGWDHAWDNGLTPEQRAEILKQHSIPSFTYTNPEIKISGDLAALVEYIVKALNEFQNVAQVKHLQWFENNSQSALQWDMMNTTTNKPFVSGWSYAKYDENGKLICVADFF